jgi:hypothetical protein
MAGYDAFYFGRGGPNTFAAGHKLPVANELELVSRDLRSLHYRLGPAPWWKAYRSLVCSGVPYLLDVHDAMITTDASNKVM